MTGRQLPSADYAGLKTSTRALIRAIGSQEDAAGVTRVLRQALSAYGSTAADHDEVFAPIDVIADLEAECGQPLVTRKLAELAGCLLIALPRGRGVPRLMEASGRTAEDMGRLFQDVGKALADGKISSREAAQLLGDIHELMVHLAEFAEAVRHEAEGGEK